MARRQRRIASRRRRRATSRTARCCATSRRGSRDTRTCRGQDRGLTDGAAARRARDAARRPPTFAAPLLLCHRSLVATGNGLIAAGRLTDILRRVAAFGLTLAPLDVRQDVGAPCRGDGRGHAAAWNLGRYDEWRAKRNASPC